MDQNCLGNVNEEIPKDIPKPLGKRVITTTFLDANLLHDILTGKSVTAILHFVNITRMLVSSILSYVFNNLEEEVAWYW